MHMHKRASSPHLHGTLIYFDSRRSGNLVANASLHARFSNVSCCATKFVNVTSEIQECIVYRGAVFLILIVKLIFLSRI